VLDRTLRLPLSLHLFDRSVQTVVLNDIKEAAGDHLQYLKPDYKTAGSPIKAVIDAIGKLGITSVLVEGGSQLIKSFIESGYWDEARVITNQLMFAGDGVPAPLLQQPVMFHQLPLGNDLIRWFKNPLNPYHLNCLNSHERC
jgi:diaminohydroxyphosphoribosylaminopyrimidine deaminase / 5-amino-6-(5-phosphoribosylamino)uracil reductase